MSGGSTSHSPSRPADAGDGLGDATVDVADLPAPLAPVGQQDAEVGLIDAAVAVAIGNASELFTHLTPVGQQDAQVAVVRHAVAV